MSAQFIHGCDWLTVITVLAGPLNVIVLAGSPNVASIFVDPLNVGVFVSFFYQRRQLVR